MTRCEVRGAVKVLEEQRDCSRKTKGIIDKGKFDMTLWNRKRAPLEHARRVIGARSGYSGSVEC
jgi:hypothetical protein